MITYQYSKNKGCAPFYECVGRRYENCLKSRIFISRHIYYVLSNQCNQPLPKGIYLNFYSHDSIKYQYYNNCIKTCLSSEFELPFYILAVDYDDYVLGYGCVDLGPVSTDVDRRIGKVHIHT